MDINFIIIKAEIDPDDKSIDSLENKNEVIIIEDLEIEV